MTSSGPLPSGPSRFPTGSAHLRDASGLTAFPPQPRGPSVGCAECSYTPPESCCVVCGSCSDDFGGVDTPEPSASHSVPFGGLTAVGAERSTVTVEEAAVALGLGRTAAYAAARRGEIPVLRFGRRWVVPIPALDAMLRGEWVPRTVTTVTPFRHSGKLPGQAAGTRIRAKGSPREHS